MIIDDVFDWLELTDKNRQNVGIAGRFRIATDTGLKRDENQDRAAVLHVATRLNSFWCACLCDGMGGMADGAAAASLSIATFFSTLISSRRLQPEHRLHVATQEANRSVSKQYPGGGATLSAICFEADRIYTVNVGDSRIFSLHSDGRLERLTVDDTMAETYGADGDGLLQHIGMKSGLLPHIERIEGNSSRFLITSDGAHIVGEEMLRSISRHALDGEKFGDRVLDLANWIGGVDNATIILVDPSRSSPSTQTKLAPDVSIWTTNGRLKIAWVPNSNPDDVPQELHGDSQSQVRSPVIEPQTARIAKKDATTQNNDRSDKQVRPNDDGANSRKPRKQKRKKEQIEIGFSDEGDSE